MIIVVGRGPSLHGRKLGGWIDSFGIVVRLTNPGPGAVDFRALSDVDYGYRCDYILTTTSRQFRYLAHCDLSNVQTVWLYKTRYLKEAIGKPDFFEEGLKAYGYNGPIIVINDKIAKWLDWYKDNYDPARTDYRSDRSRESKPTWYPSKGTAAILTAMLVDNIVVAAGFDNVLLGRKAVHGHTHDWIAENALLKMASRELGVKLLALQ